MDLESSDRPPQKPKFRLSIAAKVGLLATVVALASIGYLRTSFWQKSDSSKTSSAGLDQEELDRRKPVGQFDLIEADGKKTPFSEYQGQVVILSFWASWCTPCLVELPAFAQLAERFHDRGLRIVPVNVDDGDVGVSFAREFWKKREFDFPNFFDTERSLAAQFGVDILPANFVIDRHGRIVFSGFGANDWTSDQAIELLESLLNEP